MENTEAWPERPLYSRNGCMTCHKYLCTKYYTKREKKYFFWQISCKIWAFCSFFIIPKSRDWSIANPGIRDWGNGPGSRDPGIRDPGIGIPSHLLLEVRLFIALRLFGLLFVPYKRVTKKPERQKMFKFVKLFPSCSFNWNCDIQIKRSWPRLLGLTEQNVFSPYSFLIHYNFCLSFD